MPRPNQFPVDEQLRLFEEMIARNHLLDEVLNRAERLAFPQWYLTAGCLFQTVWNVLTGRDPTWGIKDYDLFYFDASDTSWEAEDAVIRECDAVFQKLPVEVEVRNQARVHLWYADKFGVTSNPFSSSEDGIDSFVATTCCVGLRRVGGVMTTYAPHGFGDMFGLVVRPNPVRSPHHVYQQKSKRWSELWPELRILPWPADAGR